MKIVSNCIIGFELGCCVREKGWNLDENSILGTGLMGGPMVKNLASAGYEITAWNRTSSKAEFLLQFGVDVKGLAADAVKNADVVVSMLSNGDASAQMQRIKICNKSIF